MEQRYYVILTAALDRVDRTDAAVRAVVYARARDKLTTVVQSSGADAPQDVLEREHAALEAAIGRIEQELTQAVPVFATDAVQAAPIARPADRPLGNAQPPPPKGVDARSNGEIREGVFRTALPTPRGRNPAALFAHRRWQLATIVIAFGFAVLAAAGLATSLARQALPGAPISELPDDLVIVYNAERPQDGLSRLRSFADDGTTITRSAEQGIASITRENPDPPVLMGSVGGAATRLSARTERRAAQRVVRVWIIARQSQEDTASHLAAAYTTIEHAASVPDVMPLTSEFRLYDFAYDVPSRSASDRGDAIVLWPSNNAGDGMNGTVEVSLIALQILSN
ncbi:MAG: hypothetical protein AAFX39_13090 [Pseudomonadota bacterium]